MECVINVNIPFGVFFVLSFNVSETAQLFLIAAQ